MDPARDVYRRLLDHHGPQRWWPARSDFEVIVGALLMQQTAWANVERAIASLREAGLLEPHALAAASTQVLRRHVRVAGLYRTKPARLKAFCRALVETWDGDLKAFFARPTEEVRADLLAREGIGPETADSILLYAGRHPVFVVDAYTVRIGTRVGLFAETAYDAVQGYFEAHVPRDVGVYQEYHALLVAHAKTLCRPRPACGECPLRPRCAFGRGQRSRGHRAEDRRPRDPARDPDEQQEEDAREDEEDDPEAEQARMVHRGRHVDPGHPERVRQEVVPEAREDEAEPGPHDDLHHAPHARPFARDADVPPPRRRHGPAGPERFRRGIVGDRDPGAGQRS